MKALQDEGTPSESTKSVGELTFTDLKQLAGKIYKKLKLEKVDIIPTNGTRASQPIITFILYRKGSTWIKQKFFWNWPCTERELQPRSIS